MLGKHQITFFFLLKPRLPWGLLNSILHSVWVTHFFPPWCFLVYTYHLLYASQDKQVLGFQVFFSKRFFNTKQEARKPFIYFLQIIVPAQSSSSLGDLLIHISTYRISCAGLQLFVLKQEKERNGAGSVSFLIICNYFFLICLFLQLALGNSVN